MDLEVSTKATNLPKHWALYSIANFDLDPELELVVRRGNNVTLNDHLRAPI